jgi:hypothetical protein
MIVGRDGLGSLLMLAALVALITLAFMAIAGRRLMARSSVLAAVAGCAFLPLLVNVAANLIAWNQPAGTDVGGMLVFAVLVLSIAALPVTLATSLLYVLIRRKAAATNAQRDKPRSHRSATRTREGTTGNRRR